MQSNRLKVFGLIIILCIIPLIPVIYIGITYAQQSEDIITFLKRERLGVQQVRLIYTLLKRNDNNQNYLANQHQQDMQLVASIKDSILKNLDYGSEVLQSPHIEALTNLNFQDPREKHFKDALEVVALITDHSNLILDGELNSYYLMDAFFLKYPRLLKYAEKLTHNRNISSETSTLYTFEDFLKLLEDTKLSTEKALAFDKGKLKAANNTKQLSALTSEIVIDPAQQDRTLQAFELFELPFALAGLNVLESLISERITRQVEKKINSIYMTTILASLSLLIGGALIYILIRARKTYEQEISYRQDAIEKGQRLAAAGEVFASIAHDVATPLQVISLSNELLRNYFKNVPDVENQKKILDRIDKMTKQSDAIVKNMLSLLKNNSVPQREEINLNQLCMDLQELTRHRLARHNVKLKILDETNGITVYTNPYAILQILTNLINNATDAMENTPSKNITITIRKESSAILISVQDSGPGVPIEYQQRIFDSLFTTKRSSGGTGLGLTISKKLMENLHGDLMFDGNRPGAKFTLKLPITAAV